jgi:hypothetical protein
MAKSKTGRTILCTWEMGGDLGHISRLSSITKRLEREGYNVVLALKDLSRAYPFFKDTQAKIVQAPNWLLKLQMQRPIVCQADVLLLSGYIDIEILLMFTKAWQSIIDLVKPDIFLFDYSPTAQLTLRDDKRPKIVTGTGFAEPEAGQPLADWRHYDAKDNLVVEQERVVLHAINNLLKRQNKSPLQTLSDLWRVNKTILTNYHFFDPYHEVRSNAEYCLKQTGINTYPSVKLPNFKKNKIVAYLKPNHPKFELILKALKLSDSDVFVVCPNCPEKVLKLYESNSYKYSTSLVNLPELLLQSDLFLGHGNSGSVKEAIYTKTPIIVLPIHQEQLLIGKKLEELGIGRMKIDFDNEEVLLDVIKRTLNNQNIAEEMDNIKKQLKGKNQTVEDVVRDAVVDLTA